MEDVVIPSRRDQDARLSVPCDLSQGGEFVPLAMVVVEEDELQL